jgi:hypothetical protein
MQAAIRMRPETAADALQKRWTTDRGQAYRKCRIRFRTGGTTPIRTFHGLAIGCRGSYGQGRRRTQARTDQSPDVPNPRSSGLGTRTPRGPATGRAVSRPADRGDGTTTDLGRRCCLRRRIAHPARLATSGRSIRDARSGCGRRTPCDASARWWIDPSRT